MTSKTSTLPFKLWRVFVAVLVFGAANHCIVEGCFARELTDRVYLVNAVAGHHDTGSCRVCEAEHCVSQPWTLRDTGRTEAPLVDARWWPIPVFHLLLDVCHDEAAKKALTLRRKGREVHSREINNVVFFLQSLPQAPPTALSLS